MRRRPERVATPEKQQPDGPTTIGLYCRKGEGPRFAPSPLRFCPERRQPFVKVDMQSNPLHLALCILCGLGRCAAAMGSVCEDDGWCLVMSSSSFKGRKGGRTAAPPKPVIDAPAGPTAASLPGVVVSRRGADRLRAGHVWVYRSDIAAVNFGGPEARLAPVSRAGPVLVWFAGLVGWLYTGWWFDGLDWTPP